MVTDDANMTQNVFREEALRLAEEQQLKLEADEAQTRREEFCSANVAKLEPFIAVVLYLIGLSTQQGPSASV